MEKENKAILIFAGIFFVASTVVFAGIAVALFWMGVPNQMAGVIAMIIWLSCSGISFFGGLIINFLIPKEYNYERHRSFFLLDLAFCFMWSVFSFMYLVADIDQYKTCLRRKREALQRA